METIEAHAVINTTSIEPVSPSIEHVSPQIISSEVAVTWNFEKVKASLEKTAEKYKGLVVTDENLKDMEKTHREIVKMRTSLISFRSKGRKEFKKPMDVFSSQCDKLLDIVASVEDPLTKQLDIYEERRRNSVSEEIKREYNAKADAAGIREEFRSLDINSSWTNKTAKWSETCIAIDQLVNAHQLVQKAADNQAELIENRREIALMHIKLMNAKYKLTTPIATDFVTEDNLSTLAKDGIKTLIEDEAIRRHALETAARQQVEQATITAPVVMPPPPVATKPVTPAGMWPLKMTVTFTLETEEQYKLIQELLYGVPPYIKYNSLLGDE